MQIVGLLLRGQFHPLRTCREWHPPFDLYSGGFGHYTRVVKLWNLVRNVMTSKSDRPVRITQLLTYCSAFFRQHCLLFLFYHSVEGCPFCTAISEWAETLLYLTRTSTIERWLRFCTQLFHHLFVLRNMDFKILFFSILWRLNQFVKACSSHNLRIFQAWSKY